MATDPAESQTGDPENEGGPGSERTEPLSFKDTAKKIKKEQHDDNGHATGKPSKHAKKLADIVLTARRNGSQDATELLKVFKPTEDELEARGLPRNFIKEKCTNNTVLFMADFTFEE